MAHDKLFVFSGVSLTQARLNCHSFKAGKEVIEQIDRALKEAHFTDEAPFRWIGLTLRYGLKDDERPTYEGINKKHGDLSLVMEIDTHRMLEANEEEIRNVFLEASIRALKDVAEKYSLPMAPLQALSREQLGT